MTEGKLRITIIAAAFALAAALTPAHTAAEIVVLPAEQRGRDLVLEFDARFAAGAPRDLVLRLGFSWGDTQVHVNERRPVGGNAIRFGAFGVY